MEAAITVGGAAALTEAKVRSEDAGPSEAAGHSGAAEATRGDRTDFMLLYGTKIKNYRRYIFILSVPVLFDIFDCL
jgi:hypothetical protein